MSSPGRMARYQPTPELREDPHLMALRAAHLAAEPTQGKRLPGRATCDREGDARGAEVDGARRPRRAQPSAANDNRAAANDNATVTGRRADEADACQLNPAVGQETPGIGRSGGDGEALARTDHHVPTPAEIAQDADDAVRLAMP